MERIFRAAAVISVLLKVYTIPCHDRGHINVMVVLQNCTHSLHILPGSSSDTFPASLDGTYDVSNTEVEGGIVVVEESFIAINKEVDIGVKQEEIPEDITFHNIKSEPDEMIYVCICLLLETFCHCPEISFVFVTSVFLAT
jgi:hypothetical protein